MTSVVQPSGTVTLVFTDIQGSTRLLEALGTDRYRDALREHRRIVREAFGARDGYEVDYEGDAFFYAFSSAEDAVAAVDEAMRALEGGPIRIRVGVHTGSPALDPPKYVGMDVHHAARVMSAGHGGQVVLTDETARLLPPGRFRLRPLGRHRLKDIRDAVPLHQLVVEGLPEQFPALKTLYHSTLPTPDTALVGRAREVAELHGLLTATDGPRLLTLLGPGGTGKTRLALAAAAAAGDAFPDGAFWVALAPERDPSRALAAVARALGLGEGADDDPAAAVAAALAGRRVLLVVDNAEHVLSALAGDLGELARACPALRLLVTSRERLVVAAEVVWPVPPLAERDAEALFAARAAASGAAVEPDDPAVAELCRRLDRLPLAIELAAARAVVLTPAEILARLGQRLDLLAGPRDADPRQRTLRAAVEWSYELLDADERQALRSLAAFPGGVTLDTAERAADVDLDLLQSLVDKSLLGRLPEARPPRFAMLETIRAFALDRLDAEGPEDARERAARALLSVGSGAAWSPTGLPPLGACRALEPELDNAVELAGWALGEHPGLGAALVAAWWPSLVAAGRLADVRSLVDTAADVVEEGSMAQLDLAAGQALLALQRGDAAALERAAALEERLARESFPDALAWALRDQGNAQALHGRDDVAAERYRESLAVTAPDAAAERAGTLLNLALVAQRDGRHDEAEALFGEALATGTDDVRVLHDLHHDLAIHHLLAGRADAAAPHLLRALEIVAEHRWREALVNGLYVGAVWAAGSGDDVLGCALAAAGARLGAELGGTPLDPHDPDPLVELCIDLRDRGPTAALDWLEALDRVLEALANGPRGQARTLDGAGPTRTSLD